MVYVDQLLGRYPCSISKPVMMCHLFADTEGELIDFAMDIGLERNMEVNKKGLCHFDLTPEKRELAVKNGAMALKGVDAIEQWWRIRARLE